MSDSTSLRRRSGDWSCASCIRFSAGVRRRAVLGGCHAEVSWLYGRPNGGETCATPPRHSCPGGDVRRSNIPEVDKCPCPYGLCLLGRVSHYLGAGSDTVYLAAVLIRPLETREDVHSESRLGRPSARCALRLRALGERGLVRPRLGVCSAEGSADNTGEIKHHPVIMGGICSMPCLRGLLASGRLFFVDQLAVVNRRRAIGSSGMEPASLLTSRVAAIACPASVAFAKRSTRQTFSTISRRGECSQTS